MELLQVPSEITKVTTMSHRSLRIVADTQENLTDEMMAKIMAYHGKLGHWCFLPEERKIDTLDVLNTPPLEYEKNEKSPSQRLYNALYVLWTQKGKPTATFREWYEIQMEKILSIIKEKLT